MNSSNLDTPLKLARAPIIEAIVDIDCAMPVDLNLVLIENSARQELEKQYPKVKKQFIHKHQLQANSDAPPAVSVSHGLNALQFLQNDERQLVQIRTQGYSFNRLAPYVSLDMYLDEIHRTWDVFRGIGSPTIVRVVRLRYINRIDIPIIDGKLKLDGYIKNAPVISEETNLLMAGFLDQRLGVQSETGYEANIVLTSQPPQANLLPVILDICVAASGNESPENWNWIFEKISSLRVLKNKIFTTTLTEQCLNQFRNLEYAAPQDSQS